MLEATWDYIVPNLLKIYKETIRLQTVRKLSNMSIITAMPTRINAKIFPPKI